MQFLLHSLLAVAGFSSVASAASGAHFFDKAKNAISTARSQHAQRASFDAVEKRQASGGSPYLNPNTKKFVVDGTTIPDVPFDVGESYAGLLPISDSPSESRKLFFWFFPSTNPDASDEITIWFNGGPGCSSLSGLISENGPFLWESGTLAPTKNPYSWNNLTNMLWVEQPVGVGFSQGTPNITNEVELGQEFIGFYKQFVQAFKVQNRKVYLTGESYGGFYVPYVADAFINAKDKVNYNLAGVAINDPILGDEILQTEVVIPPYVDYWANLFNLNQTFLKSLHSTSDKCGYTDYYKKYFTFPPPPGKFPVLSPTDESCDVQSSVLNAATETNPCFNVYHISDECPFRYSVLGIVNPGDYEPPGGEIYFRRPDVQKAINAPVGTSWSQCTPRNVFGGPNNNPRLSDTSLGPAQDNVLKHVIESTNNAIIGVGNLDFLLPTNGTLLALQNVTWGGKQGFQKVPANNFFVPYHAEANQGALAGAGVLGQWGTERGLTFYNVQLAGHELPAYAAGAGYRVLEKLLGRIPNLGTTVPFTTQGGRASKERRSRIEKRMGDEEM